MERQRDEDGKLEETLEQRRMEGSSLQVEVMRKVQELVVHERMSQGEKAKCAKEKKKVKGWSTEEMKNKANSLLEEDTEEEMKKWRGVSQDEMDQCWRSLAGRMELRTAKRSFQRQRHSVGMEAVAQKHERQNKKVGRRLLGQNLRLVQRIQLPATAKQAGGVGGRRRDEAAAKNEDYERSDKENQIKRKNGR